MLDSLWHLLQFNQTAPFKKEKEKKYLCSYIGCQCGVKMPFKMKSWERGLSSRMVLNMSLCGISRSLIVKARTRSRCLAISALMQAIIFVIRTSIFIILFTQILILSPALHMPSSKPLKQTMRSPFCMCNNTWTCEPGLPKACGLFQRMLNVFSSASRHYLCLIPAPKRTGIVALCQSECINFFFFSRYKLHLLMVCAPRLPFSECVCG